MPRYAVYVTLFVDAGTKQEAEEIVSNEITEGIIRNTNMSCDDFTSIDAECISYDEEIPT